MRSPVGAAAGAIQKQNRDVIAPHEAAPSLAPAPAASISKDLRTERTSAGAAGLAACPSTAVPLVRLAAGSLSMPSICCTRPLSETLNAWRRGAERTEVAGTSGVFIALWSRQGWQACSPQLRKRSVARACTATCSANRFHPPSMVISFPIQPVLSALMAASVLDCCLRSPRFSHKGGLPVLQTAPPNTTSHLCRRAPIC